MPIGQRQEVRRDVEAASGRAAKDVPFRQRHIALCGEAMTHHQRRLVRTVHEDDRASIGRTEPGRVRRVGRREIGE